MFRAGPLPSPQIPELTVHPSLEAACADHLGHNLAHSTKATTAELGGHAHLTSVLQPPQEQAQLPTAGVAALAAPQAPGSSANPEASAKKGSRCGGGPNDPSSRPALPNRDVMDLLMLQGLIPSAGRGELTPAMALCVIREHPRRKELDREDWTRLGSALALKVKCHGCVLYLSSPISSKPRPSCPT